MMSAFAPPQLLRNIAATLLVGALLLSCRASEETSCVVPTSPEDLVKTLGIANTPIGDLMIEKTHERWNVEATMRRSGASSDSLIKGMRAHFAGISYKPSEQAIIIDALRAALGKNPADLRLYSAVLSLAIRGMRDHPDVVPLALSVVEMEVFKGPWERWGQTEHINSISYLAQSPTLGVGHLQRMLDPQYWLHKDFQVETSTSESTTRQAVAYNVAGRVLSLLVDYAPIDRASAMLAEFEKNPPAPMLPQSTDKRLRAIEREAINGFQRYRAQASQNLERRRQDQPPVWKWRKDSLFGCGIVPAGENNLKGDEP